MECNFDPIKYKSSTVTKMFTQTHNTNDVNIIIADFNVKINSDKVNIFVGTFGFRSRNDREISFGYSFILSTVFTRVQREVY